MFLGGPAGPPRTDVTCKFCFILVCDFIVKFQKFALFHLYGVSQTYGIVLGQHQTNLVFVPLVNIWALQDSHRWRFWEFLKLLYVLASLPALGEEALSGAIEIIEALAKPPATLRLTACLAGRPAG